MTQTDTNKKLTPRQARAIPAIMSEPTIHAAANKAGVARKTLYRWLEQPVFAAPLREARAQTFKRTVESLAIAAELAVKVLRDILGDEKAAAQEIAAIRVR